MQFTDNQTVQGPKDKLHIYSVQTAKCSKGFKRFQTMNKGLIKRNECSFKKENTKV